jgi:hypothetical protein
MGDGIQLITSVRVSAHCGICAQLITTKEHVKANLGSGKYAYHYHITCFKQEFEQEFERIMKASDEPNPVLVARSVKSKPAWRIWRTKQCIAVRGPDCQTSRWLEVYPTNTPHLDDLIQIEAALLGRRYEAEICDQQKLDNPVFIAMFLGERKVTHIGFSNGYQKQGEPLSPDAIYLVEGIVK